MSTGYQRYPELYGSRQWRYLRQEAFDRDEYTCQMCRKLTSNPIADHIKPHNGDRELFFDLDNIQTLCPDCHSGRKRQEENKGYSAACDVNGIPISKGHPWRKGKR